MQVTFWGTRGSIAKAGPTTLRYGGNTSCVELRSDAGTLVVLDCGTGAHGLGEELVARHGDTPIEGHLLISHTHWDHIQGLPFFAPLFEPTGSWHIYGPRGLAGSLSETLGGQMQYSYFPVSIEQLTAVADYHDLVEGAFRIGDIKVTAHYLNHPALTLGYRLEVDGATVVYASDHEPHDRQLVGGDDPSLSRHDLTHVDFLAGADLLIHDSQYIAAEYPEKAGWGHSTAEYVVAIAQRAGVGQVALFHHDPGRTDEALDAVVELARARATALGYAGTVSAASEGATISLRGAPTAAAEGAHAPAIAGQAMVDMRRSVLLAVHSPDIATLLRHAAEEERLEIWETSDREEAVEIARRHRPAIVVLEEDPEGWSTKEFARAIGDLEPVPDGEISLISITATGDGPIGADDLSITDSLVWPASAGYVRTKLRAWLLRRACRWQNAPLPDDEAKRLQSLRDLGVLDTEPEARFDRFTEMASTVLDIPIALISLVDEHRQWFKSARGIEATETPRDMAICSHAILDDEVFQVPDALDDPRFADNPLVADDPRVRFYAGAPLTLSDGTRAGTLCVIDHRPRELDHAQLRELRRLADLVARELEAR
ncbi:MAG: MBL fold metallo-hydrolase [Acidimicrobiia bacterium]|nr:MBL fold metallo-hydrolase [Acidimicrobiia bacterium]